MYKTRLDLSKFSQTVNVKKFMEAWQDEKIQDMLLKRKMLGEYITDKSFDQTSFTYFSIDPTRVGVRILNCVLEGEDIIVEYDPLGSLKLHDGDTFRLVPRLLVDNVGNYKIITIDIYNKKEK